MLGTLDKTTDEGLVIREIWLLRLWALPARANGDDDAYAHYRDRYRDMAKTLNFEGHIAWAKASHDGCCPVGGGDLFVHRC